jgi:hypothetical protein
MKASFEVPPLVAPLAAFVTFSTLTRSTPHTVALRLRHRISSSRHTARTLSERTKASFEVPPLGRAAYYVHSAEGMTPSCQHLAGPGRRNAPLTGGDGSGHGPFSSGDARKWPLEDGFDMTQISRGRQNQRKRQRPPSALEAPARHTRAGEPTEAPQAPSHRD